MKVLAVLLAAALPCLGAWSDAVPQPPKKRAPVKLTDEARKIHAEALVIDGHNDLPYRLRETSDPFAKQLDIAKPQAKLHTDIPRLRQGNVGAQFWSAY